MKLKLILIGLLFILCAAHIASATQTPWIIEADKVYVDDDRAYISAEPHTITNSGYVYFTLLSKQYAGNVDLAFGFSSNNFKPVYAEYKNCLLYTSPSPRDRS